jgi:formylmethanofuran dehydrogenase subunit E
MACSLNPELIQETIAFHGHNCPGLTIGIRAAELARCNLSIHKTANSVCVTETDMCGVDAIQFLTGCSFGKGNLIHKDFGKSAFTFFNRDTGKGFRAVFNNNFSTGQTDREQRISLLLEADLEELFTWTPVDVPPVRPARILKSIVCDACSEKTMESRIRLFDGQSLCIPCFENVEQKI